MNVEVRGKTSPFAETVLFSSGLGGLGAYWEPQICPFGAHFRLVTYDQRGTGGTGEAASQAGGIAAMADDIIEIAQAHGLDSFHFVGHALGGLIGLELAWRRPDIIRSLTLVNAWSKADPHTRRCFDVRLDLLRNAGTASFLRAQPLFLYPAIWMAENAAHLEAEEARAGRTFQGQENILRRIAALLSFDADERLVGIHVPSLVVAAKDDLLVPYSRSVRLAAGLPQAALSLLDFGAHAVNVVAPDAFNAAVLAFLVQQPKHAGRSGQL